MNIKNGLGTVGQTIADFFTVYPKDFLTKKFNTGKPIYNLEVKISLAKKSFDDRIFPAMQEIKMYGEAISIAQKLFSRYNYVTDKGYVLSGHKPEVETKKATLYIYENVSGLIILNRILKGEIKDNDMRPRVHFHRKEGDMYNVKADGRYLYLKEIRDSIRDLNEIHQKLEEMVKEKSN